MYRCEICRSKVGPGVKCKKHVVHRVIKRGPLLTRTEVAREIPICEECAQALEEMPLHAVVYERGQLAEQKVRYQYVSTPLRVPAPLIAGPLPWLG